MQSPPTEAESSLRSAALTARLRVEPLRSTHAPLLFPALADPRIYAYVPDEVHATQDSLGKRYAFLERGAPPGVTDVWLNWALQRKDSAAYIGTLQATVTPDSHAYIGYVLCPTAWGQGFATEACRWLVAALQRRFVLGEILATVDVRNLPSIRVLERIDFRCIGTEPAELRGAATTDYRYRLACGSAA
ncbi:MAG: GNAT family N-acetyltransferase [Betaproteobacteria bacterium]